MGRLTASVLALFLGLAAALALASCGSGESAELLPGSTASQINSNLDQVQQLAGEGECVGAEDAASAVSNQIESLTGVDAKLKQALSEGAARLQQVVASCEEAEEPEEAAEPIEEPESEEEKEKPEKPEKQKKDEEPVEEPEEEDEGPTLPPQSNGKGEEKGGGPPPTEAEPPSGGVGPGLSVGEE